MFKKGILLLVIQKYLNGGTDDGKIVTTVPTTPMR